MHISLVVVGVLLFIAALFVCFFLPEDTYGAETGYVNASDLNVRTAPTTEGSYVVGTISYQDVTILGKETDPYGNLWYKISYGGGEYYVFGSYVTVGSSGGSPQPSAAVSASFEEQLLQFPYSYRDLIRNIHYAYPNYIFQADYINMSFDDAVLQQTFGHRKLVSMDWDGVSWRSLSPDCFNWATGTWSTFSGNWTDAGVDVIEYYMDPRNFLNTRNMYMFAQQTYTGTESRGGVEAIVGGSFLSGYYTDYTGTHNYVDVIMQAAAESHVSPYVIAATLRIEQPYGGDSPLIDGSYGYYNFFNFGAGGADVVGNGIAYARGQGWDTVYKSILGGAKSYYNGYLADGQDTYFYKDFNLVNGNFYHQYAQGVYDPVSSASFLRDALSADTGATLVLRIPVYTTMPAEAPGYPPEFYGWNPRYAQGGGIIPRSGATIYTPDEVSQIGQVAPPVSIPEVPDDNGVVIDAPAPTPETGAAYAAGDANGDGKISALDYVTVKNHILGRNVIYDGAKLQAADVNSDGKISALDYVLIKNMILGR